ncbi:uncharacterized protein C8Q71DRAFT_891101 [Rhodofomes roseus]|uniref:F-box domain-containing protein n=1 Tax=Rhodofomes roseus TaxID=34475 RepID=A0ABQ8JYZ4_9APHY|nr:uncharacterized protein C8Q71DRAFT_891101 [Rhodofomes roseus]KAH9829244.1 hypothetical protein C8Q71DRAFT_891101 [Rhodofomes roseus]
MPVGNASSNTQRWLQCEDLLRLVLSEACQQDLISASLVCRAFAAVSRSFILQQFVLDVADEDRKLVITGEPKHKSWWKHLDELDDGEDSEPERSEALEELQRHIRDGTFGEGLTEVRWDAGLDIPASLIDTTQAAFPGCTFTLDRYAGSALPPMPKLVSLDATVRFRHDPLLQFQPIFLQSPRLRCLRMTPNNRTGCVVPVVQLDELEEERAPPFLTYDSTRPLCHMTGPSIEELVLEQMSWSDEGATQCLEGMSWSRLRKLELNRCDAIPLLRACVSPRLPSLSEFKFTMWCEDYDEQTCASAVEALHNFLFSASGLEGLHLEGPYHSLVSTIAAHHGPTLQSLVLHEKERREDSQRPTLNTRDLRGLGKSCTTLRHLGIDVDANYSITQDTVSEPATLTSILNSLKHFPALNKLTLYTPIGIAGPETRHSDYRLHLLKEHAGFIMLPDIGDASAILIGRRGKLQTIVVNIGEQDRQMGIGYPAPWVLWERDNRTQLTLERAVPGHGKVLIKASRTGAIPFSFTPRGEPIAWSVVRGNRWIETEYSEPRKGLARLLKIR